jgi:coenzyme F420-reducing hydrogenase delta subunit
MKLEYRDCDYRDGANKKVGEPKITIEMSVEEMMNFSQRVSSIERSIKTAKNTLNVVNNIKWGEPNPYVNMGGVVRFDIKIDPS